MPMTREEVKKYINKEVSEICDKIANLYGELWELFMINQGGMDSSLHDDQKQHDIECKDLCQRVKSLGQLARLYVNAYVELHNSLVNKEQDK